jgi:uncharacterized protein (TIGR03663 family)
MRGTWHSGRIRLLSVVLGVTAFSLALRLVGLGGRVFHWDEARVGYWILRYGATGEFAYRPIIHGPFLPVVNDYLFALVPVSDFAARLPVALVGGLLPLSAWLVRDRLGDDEVVALAALLAANPLLVYYSRFMRNDVLVAGFAVFALAFAVRAANRADARLLYPAGVSLAFAFASKENAVVYVVCFLGAAVLVADHRLLRAVARGRSPRTVLAHDWPTALADALERWQRRPGRTDGGRAGPDRSARAGAVRLLAHLVGASLVSLAVVVFFYAPRPGLWTALGSPARLPGLVEAATLGTAGQVAETWVGGTHQSHVYLPYLYGFLETLGWGAFEVVTLAVVGFAADAYLEGRRRDAVAFATYWGVVSVVGYPVATDIEAPWAVVHAVVPLAVPAAVGLAFLVRTARGRVARGDLRVAALAGVVVLAAVGGVAAANADYHNSTDPDDRLVLQWAQPGNGLKAEGTLDRIARVSAANEGTDVVFVGSNARGTTLFYVRDESSTRSPPPGGPSWHSRLPLPWYLERAGANVTSVSPDVPYRESLADPPPVVVAYAWDRSNVAPHLDGYTASPHQFKLWDEDVVVYVDESADPRSGSTDS